MATKLTVLGIPGLGDHRNDPWATQWETAIRGEWPAEVELVFKPFSYDELFERVQISPSESLTALAKLAGSGLISGRHRRGMRLIRRR